MVVPGVALQVVVFVLSMFVVFELLVGSIRPNWSRQWREFG
jgi:hypothetical protein